MRVCRWPLPRRRTPKRSSRRLRNCSTRSLGPGSGSKGPPASSTEPSTGSGNGSTDSSARAKWTTGARCASSIATSMPSPRIWARPRRRSASLRVSSQASMRPSAKPGSETSTAPGRRGGGSIASPTWGRKSGDSRPSIAKAIARSRRVSGNSGTRSRGCPRSRSRRPRPRTRGPSTISSTRSMPPRRRPTWTSCPGAGPTRRSLSCSRRRKAPASGFRPHLPGAIRSRSCDS